MKKFRQGRPLWGISKHRYVVIVGSINGGSKRKYHYVANKKEVREIEKSLSGSQAICVWSLKYAYQGIGVNMKKFVKEQKKIST